MILLNDYYFNKDILTKCFLVKRIDLTSHY